MILPKVPGFGERLGTALSQGLQSGVTKGIDFSQKLALQQAKQKEDKNIEKARTLQSLKSTSEQLKNMAESNVSGIGIFGQWDPTPEAQQNRGTFQTLSSDLLSFYKTLFPRGITQEEFKRLEKDYLPKVGDSTSKMIGKLNGFNDLIERKLEGFQGGHGEKSSAESKSKGKQKFNASNPKHKAKANQLFKTFKDKEKVREKLKTEFEGL